MRCTRRNRPPSTRDILPDVPETAFLCACYRGSSRSLPRVVNLVRDPLPPACRPRPASPEFPDLLFQLLRFRHISGDPQHPRISPPRRGG